jgi:hypothetical protein
VPAPASWLRRLPDAIAQLERFERETVTRADVQIVLGVSKRRAVQLMHAWGAERRGGRGELELARGPLLRRWKALRRGRQYGEEEGRVASLMTALREARVSRVRVTVPRETFSAKLAGLPEGVTIEPRRVVVEFASAQDAVGKLFAIAQALGNDWERFESLVDAAGDAESGST